MVTESELGAFVQSNFIKPSLDLNLRPAHKIEAKACIGYTLQTKRDGFIPPRLLVKQSNKQQTSTEEWPIARQKRGTIKNN